MKILITGAAGFIGNELWDALSSHEPSWQKFGIDNLSRPTARAPILERGDEFYHADLRNIEALPLPHVDAVIHLAAQTSVTRSITSPISDFQANIEATLRLLLWTRTHSVREAFIYSSSNKVFGELPGVTQPIDDDQPLRPQTPYGVSKACAAMYVTELSREGYVFHQSCIYGESQRGTEDQGWIGYLLRRHREKLPIICYGEGTQVRDLLHVDDLIRAYKKAIKRELDVGTYVIGGGESNAVAFNEVIEIIGATIAEKRSWRLHDQLYFVSSNRKLFRCGWTPKIVARDWLKSAADSV